MHKFSSKASVSVLCAALGLAAAGCGQINNLKATMAFKDANQFYRGQDFRAAVAKYSETIDLCRGSEPDCTDVEAEPGVLLPRKQLRQSVPSSASRRARQ